MFLLEELEISSGGSHCTTRYFKATRDTVGSTVALQPEGSAFESQPGVFLQGLCLFSLFMRGFSLGTPASCHVQKHLC